MRDFLLVFGAAFIGGLISAVIARRRLARHEAKIKHLLLEEFNYWRDSDDGEDQIQQAVHVGAISSISNVLGAMGGHPAPWHKTTEKR